MATLMEGYRIGWPGETDAAKVLDFELRELGNTHIRIELLEFLQKKGVKITDPRPKWNTILASFRHKFGQVEGLWLCPSKKAAENLYGFSGEFPIMGDLLAYEYDPDLIISDLGKAGIFVLKPKFIKAEERYV